MNTLVLVIWNAEIVPDQFGSIFWSKFPISRAIISGVSFPDQRNELAI